MMKGLLIGAVVAIAAVVVVKKVTTEEYITVKPKEDNKESEAVEETEETEEVSDKKTVLKEKVNKVAMKLSSFVIEHNDIINAVMLVASIAATIVKCIHEYYTVREIHSMKKQLDFIAKGMMA